MQNPEATLPPLRADTTPLLLGPDRHQAPVLDQCRTRKRMTAWNRLARFKTCSALSAISAAAAVVAHLALRPLQLRHRRNLVPSTLAGNRSRSRSRNRSLNHTTIRPRQLPICLPQLSAAASRLKFYPCSTPTMPIMLQPGSAAIAIWAAPPMHTDLLPLNRFRSTRSTRKAARLPHILPRAYRSRPRPGPVMPVNRLRCGSAPRPADLLPEAFRVCRPSLLMR